MAEKTILLVEDDKALAMGTVFVLEAEGYKVKCWYIKEGGSGS